MTIEFAPRVNGLLALTALVVPLAACVDYFVVEHEEGEPVWSGTMTAGTAAVEADCRPFRMVLFLEDAPALKQTDLEGWAEPVDAPPPALLRDYYASWWIDGEIYPNGTVLFSLRRQSPEVDGPLFASHWRGELEGERLIAEEQPVSCGRTLVAERKP